MIEGILEGRELRYPVSFRNSLFRQLAISLLRPFTPIEVHKLPESVDRASALIKEGYMIWTLGTHPTKREAIELITCPLEYIEELARLPIVMPVSLHQFLKEQRIIEPVLNLGGVTAAPLVNEDAIEHMIEIKAKLGRKVHRGEGLRQYVRLIHEAFTVGGAAGIAPQGGRERVLELSQAKYGTIEFLIKNAQIDVNKLAFLFVSMGPANKSDYGKIFNSLNLFKTWKIDFLRTVTLPEMYIALNEVNQMLQEEATIEEGKFSLTLDELILVILSLGMDDDYNKIPRGYQNLLESVKQFAGVMQALRELY